MNSGTTTNQTREITAVAKVANINVTKKAKSQLPLSVAKVIAKQTKAVTAIKNRISN